MLMQTAYAPIPENRQLDHSLGLGSGSGSFGQHGQGSGQLPIALGQGSGQLGMNPSQGSGQFNISPSQSGQFGVSNSQSGHFGISPSQSGQLGFSSSQGSGQLLGQALGQSRSGSLTAAAGYQGVGQIGGSPHLSGAGQSRSQSPFSLQSNQQFQSNGGRNTICITCYVNLPTGVLWCTSNLMTWS